MKKTEMAVLKSYKATEGAQFDKKKAQIYGECLEKISEKKGRKLKAKDVVDEARSKNNPLHEVFDWDNTSAAEKYRLEQARHLINHIVVPIKYNDGVKDTKAWVSINSTPDEETLTKVYVNTEDALTKKEYRKQILDNAIKEAEYWQKQYAQYSELNLIFEAISRTRERLMKKKLAKDKKKLAKTNKVITKVPTRKVLLNEIYA